jgi:hypothetical protein
MPDTQAEPASESEEWSTSYDPSWRSLHASVDVRPDLTPEEFRDGYLGRQPVVFSVGAALNSALRERTRKSRLLREAQARLVGVDLPVSKLRFAPEALSFPDFVARHVDHGFDPHELVVANAERGPKYLFGPSDPQRGWVVDSALYDPPRFYQGKRLVLMMGVGGSGVGVHWHVHAAVMNETIHGRKRWLLHPPGPGDAAIGIDQESTQSALGWITEVLPSLPASRRPRDVEVGIGEVIYVPDHWWHLTLNLGQTVSVACYSKDG